MAFIKSSIKQHLNELTAAIPAVIYQLLIEHDGGKKFTFVSPGVEEMFQVTATEVCNDCTLLNSKIHPEEIELHSRETTAYYSKRIPCNYERQIIVKDGTVKHIQVKATPQPLEDGGVLWNGVILDITQRKYLEHKIRQLSTRDQLTGLPNRSLLVEQVNTALATLKNQPDQRFAVLFVGIDRFSVVNDSLGHGFGDDLLKQVFNRIMLSLKGGDTIARFGEDKFIVLVHEVKDINHVVRAVEAIRRSLPLHINLKVMLCLFQLLPELF